MKQVGQRVLLETLLMRGKFPGEIIKVGGGIFGDDETVTVKLDRQDKPVSGVLYYDDPPEEIKSSRWQFCYPVDAAKEAGL